MHAPLATVQRFGTVKSDARKVANAMLLELDWGASNISRALALAGMLEDTIWIVHSDNGGPGSHACNYPLRGGKFSFWEGGLRGVALMSGVPIPAAVRGTNFDGLAHLSDIYATVAVGFGAIDPEALRATGTALSGSISTVLTGLSWICVGIHSRRALTSPVCA